MKAPISRRQFIASSAMAAAGISIVPRHVLGKGFIPPSDKIRLGFIGTGRQSGGLAGNFLMLDSVEMVAACDVYKAKLAGFENFVKDTYKEKTGKSEWKGFERYHDYKEILDRDDIDAVIIATPDHWHAKPSIDAANAGKHVYCEKPLSHTVEQGREMVKAARKNNITFQTGSMQRSWESFRHACELVYNGYLGEIKKVIVSVGDPAIPCDLEAEDKPEGLDWDRWIGPAQMRPFNAILAPPPEDKGWPMWRKYKEFGGGILCDWGAHMFDIVQWALGMDDTGPVELIPPKTPVPKRGLMMRYANGVEVYHYEFGRGWGVEFHGTEGTMQVSRSFLDTKPEKIATTVIKSSDKRLYKSDNHYQNWIDCIKSGEKPVCDVEIGHRSATVCNIGNIAYWLGKDLKWDPEKERFDDKEANEHLSTTYRDGYEI